jgi:ABC-2 type transport system ATP-binding protein
MRNAPAYEVRNLRKVYQSPHVVANDGITLVAELGDAVGLLGPNGAGKSTLVRQLVGLLTPTSGEIMLFGEAVKPGIAADRRVGRTVAYLPQGAMSLGELRVGEAVLWTGMLRGLGKATAQTETEELVETLQLAEIVDHQIRKLSSGQKRLVQIGMSLIGRLPVLILDEPTADIDPGLRRRVWELISTRASMGAAVILVTHDVAEAEHVLNRVAIIDKGRIVAMGTPGQLKADLAHRTRIEVVLAEAATLDAELLAAELGGEAMVRGRRISAWVPAEVALPTLEKVMASAGADVFEDVRMITPTLEDVYLEASRHSMKEGAS